jgi:hypothetical protein
MEKHNLTLLASVTAIILSVIAICTSLKAFSLSSTAYLGVVVAVLSMLVVVLIGWQIYSFFDFKESSRKIESLVQITAYQSGLVDLSTAMALSDFYYILNTDDKRDIEFKFLHYSVIAIMHASGVKDFKTCNSIVKMMLDVVVKPDLIRLSKYNKSLIFDIIAHVKHGNEIENYNELLQVLAKIQTA